MELRWRFPFAVFLTFLGITSCASFAPPTFSFSKCELTVLFGFRANLRNKFSISRIAKSFRSQSNKKASASTTQLVSSSPPEPATRHSLAYPSNPTSSKETANSVNLSPVFAKVEESPHKLHLETVPVKCATLTRALHAVSQSHVSLYSLPERHHQLNELEQEFRDMLQHFSDYSEADILSVADPRKRALFEGVAASAHSQPVYRAFEILYEDLLPLRVAGRIIFKRLKHFMNMSVQQREDDVRGVIELTGLVEDKKNIEEIRLMFVTTASSFNGDSFLTLEQLTESGIITATATEVLKFGSSQDLMQHLDPEQRGKLTFLELMNGLWQCAQDMCGLEMCNPTAVLHNLLVELNEHPPPPADLNARLDSARQKYSSRYDSMVASFVDWKDLIPEREENKPESRRIEVVRGCFVGAENRMVVDALRIVYVDYAGLRVAGDIIFKLVSSLMKSRASKIH